jgi:tryptophan synthase alpha chain
MNRIAQTFATLKQQHKTALITYIMAGDPTIQANLAIMHALCAGGVDLLEVGIPFSDPTADGVAIQQAGLRSLKNGTKLSHVLELCHNFRATNQTTPIILMGYANPIMQYGYEQFAIDAAKAGVDGMIVVDLPPEEEDELQPYLNQNHVDFVRLIAPTTSGARLQRLLQTASGFVYSINIKGITGSASASDAEITSRINEIRNLTTLPVVAGFGIRTKEQVSALHQICDGVVVGSALIGAINDAIQSQPDINYQDLSHIAMEFVQQLQ